ncbi:MAG: 5-formyltetrahydrofolate cyclo-ligase [Eggerthellaceae bacterium]|nr:5-formyltetrahydrofolate cyclo-ligase [Eggerthellaceae bacterium]
MAEKTIHGSSAELTDVRMKSDARAYYRALRESLGAEGRVAADAAIAEHVRALPEFEQADAVFTYLSVGAEVDTRRIIRMAWDAGKLVAVPRCVPNSNEMRWHRLESFDGLELGAFGIEEPPDDASTLVEVPAPGSNTRAVALVPGYSFDKAGYRLGYGGGFYDVFLPRFGGISIGLCRAAQLSPSPLPCDPHDVPVDIVICDEEASRAS